MNTADPLYCMYDGNYYDDEIPFISADAERSDKKPLYGFGPKSMEKDEKVSLIINYDFNKILKNDIYFYINSLIIKKEYIKSFAEICKNTFQFREVIMRHKFDKDLYDDKSYGHLIVDNYKALTDYTFSTFTCYDPEVAPIRTVATYEKLHLKKDLVASNELTIDSYEYPSVLLKEDTVKALKSLNLVGVRFEKLYTLGAHAVINGFHES